LRINTKLVLDKSIPLCTWNKIPMWEYDLVISDYIEELKERKKQNDKQNEKNKNANTKNRLPKVPKFKVPKYK